MVKKSNIYFIKRRKVAWGDYSQIQLEYDLLRESIKNKYMYYHLISGVDLPIKNQDYIHAFFKEHKGKEFVSFDYDQDIEKFKYRFDLYHFHQNRYANKRNFFYYLDKFLQKVQCFLRIHRISSIPYEVKKGANWFSITHNLAEYILKQEPVCKKIFKYTRCCDEVFLQTFTYNSEFKSHLYYNEVAIRNYNMRFVDFQRGNPYVFTANDYEELCNRQELFARKFDWFIDQEIIRKIEENNLKEHYNDQ